MIFGARFADRLNAPGRPGQLLQLFVPLLMMVACRVVLVRDQRHFDAQRQDVLDER
ncbi:MAG: hypothetical protein ACI9MC_001359 [Kiritimatiellia bacterium]|jgi:hypothetical protein